MLTSFSEIDTPRARGRLSFLVLFKLSLQLIFGFVAWGLGTAINIRIQIGKCQ